jgi:hypothetical protein
VKNCRNGFICLCLLVLFSVFPGRAQQQPSEIPPAAQSAPDPQPSEAAPPEQNQTSQNPASQNPTTQNPATPAPAPQTQTPPKPAAQNPTSQSPAQPADPQQTLPQQPNNGPTVQVAPEPPKYPDVRLPSEQGFYIGVGAWLPKENPVFNKGRNSGIVNNSLIDMQGSPKFADDVEAGIPLGLHNSLSISYFQTRASGDFTTGANLSAWNQTYTPGTYVSTNYRIQDIKLSFAYLTWPYPVESRKFRLKTLWQVQYVNVRTVFDAPKLPLTDSSGNPLIGADGNPLSYAAQGTRSIILPTLGLNWTQFVTRNVRFEANGSGFAIPRHSTLIDADASANIRIAPHLELRLGAKAFHFKTSSDYQFYIKNTMIAAFFGLRWYFD